MNGFRAGTFLASAVFALSALALREGSAGEGSQSWSAAAQALMVPSFLIGMASCYWRAWLLMRSRVSTADKWKQVTAMGMLAAATRAAGGPGRAAKAWRAAAASALVQGPTTSGSVSEGVDRDPEVGSTSMMMMSDAGNVNVAGNVDREAGQLQAAAAEDESRQLQQHGTRWRRLLAATLDAFHLRFLAECQYEIRARYVLAKTEDLDVAEAVFREGLSRFPRSAFLRVTHSLFVRHYRGDLTTAVARLRGVNDACRPALDHRYLVFEKIRAWEQVAHGTHIGQSMNSLSLLEFQQVFSAAQKKHAEALVLLKKFWKGVSQRNNAKFIAGASHYLEKLSRASRETQESYTSLLRKFRNKTVLRAYADFLRCVMNDPEKAASYILKADELEDAEARRIAGGNAVDAVAAQSEDGSSSMGDSATGAQSETAKRRKLEQFHQILNNEGQLAAVRALHLGIAIGLGVLALLVAGSYISSRVLLDHVNNGLFRIAQAAQLGRFLCGTMFQSRDAVLSATLGDTATYNYQNSRLLSRSGIIRDLLSGLYLGDNVTTPSSSPNIVALFHDKRLHYDDFVEGTGLAPGDTLVQEYGSLWDLGMLMSGRAQEFSKLPMAEKKANGRRNRAFRFIQDTGMPVFFEALWELVTAYETEIYGFADKIKGFNGAFVAAIVITELVLVLTVLRPAIGRVQRTKSGVSDILNRIPRKALRKIARYYSKMRGPMDEAEDVSESEDEAEGKGEGPGEGEGE
eukprot:tig00000073_g1686.t1